MARQPWWELDGQDAYELLGIAEDASPQEIVRAHRRQMKVWHTDTSDLAGAEDRSRYLNKAREVLEHHRAAYDEHRRRPKQSQAVEEDPWDEPDPWDEIPDDPWEGADAGPYPPRPPPYRMPPQHRPMPPPPQYDYAPNPGFSTPYPPPRPRPRPLLSRKSKILLTLAVGFYVLPFTAFAAAVVLSNSSEDPAPEPSVSVGQRFAGTWEGRVTEGTSTWTVELTLRAGRRNGKVTYLSGKCVGTAVPVSETPEHLTMSTEFPEGSKGCDVGDFLLARGKDGTLRLTYQNENGKVWASVVLRRG